MSVRTAVRRPAFGSYGRRVIATLCTWEILALIPGSPVPTISATVRKYPPFGWLLLGLLGHHWFIEAATEALSVVEDALEAAVDDMSATLD